ncbi:serine/threonine-protein kinase-like protein CR4 [Ananas comosus]|uniref:non-specific serine/threonine protein kinase n=1 Tax=Ananas comosus TaxID=4615 RepID=A0A6P5GF38_ANACO|nr:serine/threonine-protein kinase-like protein CR4 [Ananas comosus]
MSSKKHKFLTQIAILVFIFGSVTMGVLSLGSMSSIAVSYGENGPVFCGLSSDGSHSVTCFGADASIVYGAPFRLPLLGLTAGDGFVCGLLLETNQPYCWGSNIYVKMGVPQPMEEGAQYSEISAGDDHLCALRVPGKMPHRGISSIDCWGYNMTASHAFAGGIESISAGSVFNCGLFARNKTAFCWGDETGSGVIGLTPKNVRFRSISAGGFHVCGVLENAQVICWGRSLEMRQTSSSGILGQGDVNMVPMDPMVAVVGGRFHSCGIKSDDHHVVCWGFTLRNSVPPPKQTKVYEIAAGDYFTCGVLAENSLRPICWGTGGPWSIPMAVSPGICASTPCGPGYYEYTHPGLGSKICKPANSRVCLPCSVGCPDGNYQSTPCNATSDRGCEFDCSSCVSGDCLTFCADQKKSKTRKLFSLQMPIFVAEIVFAVVLVSAVSVVAFLYVRYKLRNCRCSKTELRVVKNRAYSFHKESVKIQPDMEELKIRRAQTFTYEELEKATGGFCEESQVGKGSFSCVFKGILKDGTVVAVKRAIKASDVKKSSKEFHTELDLLSRLNHAHLLNLLGYCEEGGERLLVYEFMAHGSLYQYLHGKDPRQKEQLDWVRRVTIAVQAARGIEYLHGYACPPVIHRDIKSSNILIDEEHNARVADFGLSLLGPADSSSPLSELPAGTLGYLDPEYYRLHYLTTKSDVYSFGVLLLEILSGRKAIDMQYEEGNIVEWAVPLIKSGDISAMLDPVLKPPTDLEALKKIAAIACKCVRMRGKDRPSMDKVTTALERALALLMGSPCNEQPILPTEVVLGSSRMNKKASQRSSNQSCSENDLADAEDQRTEYRAPSWITFPSVTSSQRRKSSASEADMDANMKNNSEGKNVGDSGRDGLTSLEEEIGPASPHEDLFLQHNF